MVGSLALSATPVLEDQGVALCLVSTLRPFRHGWPYQEDKTPADIALGVIETCKLPHDDKVVTPFGAADAIVLRKANYKDVYGLVLTYCHSSRDTHATGTQIVDAKMTSLDESFCKGKIVSRA